MNYRTILAAVVMVAALGGCSKNAGQANNPQVTDANVADAKEPPINPRTHFAAGQLAESRGETEAAISQYRRALTLESNHVQALYRLGCVYAQTKRYGDSIAIWQRYVKATNGSSTGYSNLAYTEELAGNPIAAEADYKRGIENDPQNEPCRINYGLMLARHGRNAEAIVQLQAVLPPSHVHFNLASVYELQNRKERAKTEYQKAVALDPNFSDARSKLASLGDYAEEATDENFEE